VAAHAHASALNSNVARPGHTFHVALEGGETHFSEFADELVAATRELVVPSTPDVNPYRVRGDRLEIIAVFHGRQKWLKRL
jgi:plasmid stabilization system protein ParE